MRTIVNGKEPVTSLWCAPSIKPDKYRLMRYHVKIQRDESVYLLNVVTGELVLLTTEENRILDNLPSTYSPEMDDLITHRFLVPEGFDELTSVVQLRKVMRSLTFSSDEVTSYTILPTTSCNARCFYCYESDYPRRSMNEEIARMTVDYIESHCGKDKKVKLNWYGGEPTLGERWIDYICDCLNKRGIGFSSGMISNGYLFTREMAQKAKKKWLLQSIQITLDGTEEVYNKVKAYADLEGSPYRRVLDNIGYLLDEEVYVSIRMNLDQHNADNLKLLIDELAERFPHNDYFSVYVHEIFEGMGYDPIHRSERELKDIIGVKQSIESHIDSKGLKRSVRTTVKELPSLKISYCMSDNPKSVMINPEGRIGKCQHTQYSHLVGDVTDTGITNESELLYWLDYQPIIGCTDCPLFPSCGIPKSCECGRVCIPAEVNQKLDAIKNLCFNTINKMVDGRE